MKVGLSVFQEVADVSKVKSGRLHWLEVEERKLAAAGVKGRLACLSLRQTAFDDTATDNDGITIKNTLASSRLRSLTSGKAR